MVKTLYKLTGSLLSLASPLCAEGASYDSAVRAVLDRHCVACHDSADSSAALDLSGFDAIVAGSDSGEIVTAGEPDDSLLYLVTAHAEEPAMPPDGQRIPDEDLAVLRRWIQLGLPRSDNDIDPARLAKPDPASPLAVTPSPPSSATDTPPVRLGPVIAIAASDATDRLAIGRQLEVWLYEASTQRPLGVLPFPEGEPQSLAFSADGQWLTIAGGEHGQSGAVAVWSLTPDPALAWRWASGRDAILTADLSADRRHVVVGDPSRKVRVVSTLSAEVVHTHEKPTDWVLTTRFSPDGLLVAATDRDGGVYVWEAESGALLHSLRGHKDAAVALEWLEGGDVLATASLDGDVRLWDMHTGAPRGRWSAHEKGVAALAVADDGQLLTLGREDRLVRSWARDGAGADYASMSASRLLSMATAKPSGVFFGTQRGEVHVRNDVAQGLSVVTTFNTPPEKRFAERPAETDVRLALRLADPPGPKPISAVAASELLEVKLSETGSTPGGDAGLSDFERSVRSARLADAIATLRRLEEGVEGLGLRDSKELQEARLLLGLTRERFERAAEAESPDQDPTTR